MMKSGSLSPNIGDGNYFYFVNIGIPKKIAIIEPESCFWSIIDTDFLIDELKIINYEFEKYKHEMQKELNILRFGLKPSAVYFNPTEKCNLNCSYCYIPENIRKNGKSMRKKEIKKYLSILNDYFSKFIYDLYKINPQIIFHGSEPLILKKELFDVMEEFKDKFTFGIQTNATLISEEDISYVKNNNISIGISLDGCSEDLADKTRKDWEGRGYFKKVLDVVEKFVDHPKMNLMVTVTKFNYERLSEIIAFFHRLGVKLIMLNPVRCTQEGGLKLKPDDEKLLHHFVKALDKSFELFEETGRKIVISNFANILAGILGPTTRKLMCDISPCGAGRCFFALSAKGDLFPCSEFIGISEFNGGNIDKDDLSSILKSKPFETVTSRKVENLFPCSKCSIKHFCGAPCPAEIYNLKKTLNAASPYCLFYQGIIQYCFKILAEGKEKAFLWDGWEKDVDLVYQIER